MGAMTVAKIKAGSLGLFASGLLVLCGVVAVRGGMAEMARSRDSPPTVSGLMLSDFHFDPFHDPAKARRLAAAPVSAWKGILEEPDSPGRQQALDALQKTCQVHGYDTSTYPQLMSWFA